MQSAILLVINFFFVDFNNTFRGAAHSVCNLLMKETEPNFCVIFHNFGGFDSAFCTAAMNEKINNNKNVTVIAKSSRKPIAFKFNKFTIKDSLNFMNAGLDRIIRETGKENDGMCKKNFPLTMEWLYGKYEKLANDDDEMRTNAL